MNKAALIAIVSTVSVLLIVLVLFFATSDADFGDKKREFSELGGDFTLQSSEGAVSLSRFQNKVVVMYFGFLTCPEVCPNSMTIVSSALNKLSPAQLAETQALLVSIDPKRDTPEKLAEYAKFYHQNLLGLTGSKNEIDVVTNQYGAYYNFTEIEAVTADYGVEHSSRYYVIDRAGNLVTAMRHSTTANELYAQIIQLLDKGAAS